MKEREELSTMAAFIIKFIDDHKPPKALEEANSLLPHRVPATLPAAYVNKILKNDNHLCKCLTCDPAYIKHLEKETYARLVQEFEVTTKYKLMKETVKAIRNAVTEDAEQVIRKEIREGILEEEILSQKEKSAKKLMLNIVSKCIKRWRQKSKRTTERSWG